MDDAVQEQFFEAVMRGRLGQVRALVKEHPDLLAARNDSGLSGVLTALYYREPEIATLLLHLGAPLDFFESAAMGDTDRMETMLDAQPDLLESFSPDGFQALHLAAFFGRAQVVRLLVERGAGANTYSRNGFGVMPLHSAVAGRHLDAARALLEHGADPNAVQSEDFTPLMAAAQNGMADMVTLLLSFGADPHRRTRDGRTPGDIAREKGFTDLGL